MSHFLTFVLVGGGEADAAGRASELMRPYFAPDGVYSSGEPRAKCDGYVVGGRYDGQLFGAVPEYNLTPTEFQKRYGLDVVRNGDNIRPASEVPEGLVPYAVVTPEGAWLDCEKKGAAAWAAEVRVLLRRYADCVVVAVDCHC
ncbi:MAG TPA: hypothetical protein VF297_29445 [Pyrinomonadaceae bacterium]